MLARTSLAAVEEGGLEAAVMAALEMMMECIMMVSCMMVMVLVIMMIDHGG